MKLLMLAICYRPRAARRAAATRGGGVEREGGNVAAVGELRVSTARHITPPRCQINSRILSRLIMSFISSEFVPPVFLQ